MGVVVVNPHEIEFLASEAVAKSLVSSVHGDNNVTIFPGTLRDYFAGQALVGLIANPAGIVAAERAGKESGFTQERVLSSMAYVYADAMLKAREES